METAAFLKGKILSWNVQHDGKTVDITEANLLRLNRRLFQRLFAIVLGVDAYDDDPLASREERAELARDVFLSEQK